jgi:hypothetical protein
MIDSGFGFSQITPDAIENPINEVDGFRTGKFAGNFQGFVDDDGARRGRETQ